MKRFGARVLAAVAALLSAMLAFAIPGSSAYAAGMIGFLLLPLLLGSAIGKPIAIENGVRYVTGRNGAQQLDFFARWMGALAIAAFGYFSQSRDGLIFAVFAALIGNGCALLAAGGLYSSLFAPESDAHGVTLEETTLTMNNSDGQRVLRYADLESVEQDERRIVLSTSTVRHVFMVQGSAAAAARVAQAIVDAKAKAKAAAAAQNEDTRTRPLERASGMSTREWFGRLDAIAAASRSATAYRGGAIDEEHLCSVLADEAAAVETRTAAARVLASSDNPEVRTRVASSVKGISDDRTRVRVELAMRPDTEEAAAEMEALEMEELRRTAGV